MAARNRHSYLDLSDSNRIRTHNHLVCKQAVNHLAKLARIAYVVSTYLYGAFAYILFSCQVRVSE